jgi:F-type H+-transporting ATPase subunit a
MHLSPDQVVFWQLGWFKLNATIVWTWALMLFLLLGSALITRQLGNFDKRSRWQNLLEIIVLGLKGQIEAVGLADGAQYIGFLGTLFLFVASASLFTVLPGYQPPTASLSTTVALALCVMVAVPLFGIADRGLLNYLKSYLEPTVLMLPFNLIGELSRTLALAVRLFGNMMSGAMIVGILLTITPFLFPVVMTTLGLLTGLVQAYIFFVLAAVYIVAATRVRSPTSAAAPAAKHIAKPIAKPVAEPADKPPEKPITEPADKPPGKPITEPADKPPEPPIVEPADKPVPQTEPTTPPREK